VVSDSGNPWLVLRPPIVYGPCDVATRLLVRQGLAPLVLVPRPKRPLSIAFVGDMVEAIRCAARSTVVHRFVPIDGAARSDTDALMRAIAATRGRRPRLCHVPTPVIRAAAVAADGWSRLRGRPSFFSVDKIRDLASPGWVAAAGPARELLGFEPSTAISEGLRLTLSLDPPRAARG
jgi:nucleoside-diphosphate-sugar epimerase